MDPYLEHPSLWPAVHNRLIGAIADDLSPRLAPRYFIDVERRTYVLKPDELVLVGIPDVVVSPARGQPRPAELPLAASGVLQVEVPMGADEVSEYYLEIQDVKTRRVVTVIELLSPVNKSAEGRGRYLQKRLKVMETRTSLVEIDLLRAGEPMPLASDPVPESDYRLLVSRSWERPSALLFPFNVRDPIPTFPLPLLEGEEPPEVDLNQILHDLYSRARYDLVIDCAKEPAPPLRAADRDWASSLLEEK